MFSPALGARQPCLRPQGPAGAARRSASAGSPGSSSGWSSAVCSIAAAARLNMSEMQRVALGRALVTEPRLLLLDEPMSNLDAHLRQQLRTELKQIQAALDQTVLYVTHDQLEAMSMSDRIAVMHEGQLQQLGTPRRDLPPSGQPLRRRVHRRSADQRPALHRVARSGRPAGDLRRSARRCACEAWPLRRARSRWRSGRTASTRVASRPPARWRPWSASSRTSAPSMSLHVEREAHLLRVVAPPHRAAVGETVHLVADWSRAHLIEVASGRIAPQSVREKAA